MLELRDIRKSYGPVKVLNGITLSFQPGEIMSIVGPSGAGKTTLLQIAGTLDQPDSGEVIFKGENLLKFKDRKLSKFRNLNLGFIFQFHQLLPEFSSLENVALPALIAGRKRKEAFRDAEKWLTELGLGHRLKHKPSELSGGEKQRTAIARALINTPSIVLADEPTGSLDSKNRDEIKMIISDLRDNYHQSFVIVTHDPEMAEIADRKVVMADGRIVEPCEKVSEEEIQKTLNTINLDSVYLDSDSENIIEETDNNQTKSEDSNNILQ